MTAPRFIARWDLDKTYLRTDFDTVRDLVRTAIERPDQKRTVPGAAALLRELGRSNVETHILSGSPEQLRSRIIEKLRLDGVKYASLTLKPNLQNILRLRWRALRGQLGYKLPALLLGRCELTEQRDRSALVQEALLGDDAEADAFVYCLYSDVCRGVVGETLLTEVLSRGGAYEDSIRDAVRLSKYIVKGAVVQRILIHLDRQSSPSDFKVFGSRVVPFYNYLQAAFVLFEDHRIAAESVLRIASDLVVIHNFERSSLSRSYLDLVRRGHVTGERTDDLRRSLTELLSTRRSSAASELVAMLETIESTSPAPASSRGGAPHAAEEIDYLGLVAKHNPRRKR